MYRFALALGVALALSFAAMAQPMFQSVSAQDAPILQTGTEHQHCPVCGMFLPKFFRTNHAIEHPNGEITQYCSLHCVADVLRTGTIKPDQIERILVANTNAPEFIAAEQAVYVVGSEIPGTMSATSKYAFASTDEAQAFRTEHGGVIMDHQAALNVAQRDFEQDHKRVDKKRAARMYPMGKKLYASRCNQQMLESITTWNIGAFKTILKESNACGAQLNDMQAQAISLYFWHRVRQ